ncbi:hypothetical protein [Methanospirillum hungatei]|jgi:hypothetical protein|nr:hypothetical protein [Methanospirillum hungatei]OQA54175.1 MAG: hypothetical protein BWY45_02685 [Euryarchaeota archaeon ADurb.Bin294]HOW04325.1 hypothetical protein [Methanospirillum hungatei]
MIPDGVPGESHMRGGSWADRERHLMITGYVDDSQEQNDKVPNRDLAP